MFSLSVAFEPSKGIGLNGIMPWHYKEELKLFKRNTLYHSVIMGRTTVEGLPRKLVDRKVYAVTRDKSYTPKFDDVTVIYDLEEFLQQHLNDEEEYIICGGASIYKQAYKYCTKAYVSFIHENYEADTYFDCFNLDEWEIVNQEEYEGFSFKELKRK